MYVKAFQKYAEKKNLSFFFEKKLVKLSNFAKLIVVFAMQTPL